MISVHPGPPGTIQEVVAPRDPIKCQEVSKQYKGPARIWKQS